MARRQKTKLKEKAKRVFALEVAMADGASRVQKIEALQALGVKISRKADTVRVNKKVAKAAFDAGEFLNYVEERRKAANRRRNERRRRRS